MKSGWYNCKENKLYQDIRIIIINAEKFKNKKIKLGSLDSSVTKDDDIYPLN